VIFQGSPRRKLGTPFIKYVEAASFTWGNIPTGEKVLPTNRGGEKKRNSSNPLTPRGGEKKKEVEVPSNLFHKKRVSVFVALKKKTKPP